MSIHPNQVGEQQVTLGTLGHAKVTAIPTTSMMNRIQEMRQNAWRRGEGEPPLDATAEALEDALQRVTKTLNDVRAHAEQEQLSDDEMDYLMKREQGDWFIGTDCARQMFFKELGARRHIRPNGSVIVPFGGLPERERVLIRVYREERANRG